VKSRFILLAVVVGSVLLALALGDSPWPPI